MLIENKLPSKPSILHLLYRSLYLHSRFSKNKHILFAQSENKNKEFSFLPGIHVHKF